MSHNMSSRREWVAESATWRGEEWKCLHTQPERFLTLLFLAKVWRHALSYTVAPLTPYVQIHSPSHNQIDFRHRTTNKGKKRIELWVNDAYPCLFISPAAYTGMQHKETFPSVFFTPLTLLSPSHFSIIHSLSLNHVLEVHIEDVTRGKHCHQNFRGSISAALYFAGSFHATLQ